MGKKRVVGQCRLCLKVAKLCHSHIIPESCYGSLYGDKHKFIGLMNTGREKFAQKGLREYLLCNICEEFLNCNFEMYFNRIWLDQGVIPEKVDTSIESVDVGDYAKFKLYHMRVLFLAHCASDDFWGEVNLGPHSELLRQALLNRAVPSNTRYTISARLIHDKNNIIQRKMIARPERHKYEAHTVYHFLFAGCLWGYKISSHTTKDDRVEYLNEDGILPIEWCDQRILKTYVATSHLLLTKTDGHHNV